MYPIKNLLSKSIAMAVAASPMAAFASLTIVTDSGRAEELKQVVSSDDVYKQVVDIGQKKFINHPVESFASDLPLGVVLPSIIPSDWTVDISDELSEFPVTWEKTGNWDDVIVEISKRHNLVVMFDWNRNALEMKVNDAEMLKLDSSKLTIAKTESINNGSDTAIAQIPQDPLFITTPVVADEDMSVADSVTFCSESSQGECSSQKVDIEKLVLDTDWLDDGEAIEHIDAELDAAYLVDSEIDSDSIEDSAKLDEIARLETEQELSDLETAMERDHQLRAAYNSSYILHGDGSYEDFVNSGGQIDDADPDTEYVYVFKRGKLFDTITKWSELNGYYVENDIFAAKKIDYPNSQDIKIKGKYRDVVTLLLNKYRNAEAPVNHKYYIGGGSYTLHIFESKYESLYLN
ncbi:hypothetical protein OTK49_26710 [Vibrio coralliirubri]|uniref:hypothetical protein n=1 Tax=Vibrio coralliirubri TaxID=1516159 RepID=UPI0022846E8D|nr:hypothetical protein [Vibrio coralliirubri]MCY9866133.1 hypothetical protein [Vibrio coralliirubri]